MIKLSVLLSYSLLVLAGIIAIYGVVFYFSKTESVSHFNSQLIARNGDNIETVFWINGQYKTDGPSFVVGKKISIDLWVYVRNVDIEKFKDDEYRKNWGVLFVQNSENPDEARKDLSDVSAKDMDRSFVNPGILRIVDYSLEKKTFKYSGQVIFTKPGSLELGSSFIEPYIQELRKSGRFGLTVDPGYVQHQIDTNRIMKLLAFITTALAFGTLALSLRV